jgi:hypothetical protein
MPILTWWPKASREAKKQAIRVANRESFSLGPVRLPAIRGWRSYQRGLLQPLELRAFRDFLSQIDPDRPLREVREQMTDILKWRTGAATPRDVRRCTYKKCSRFFLVSKSRDDRLYCSPKCGSNFRASKSMNKNNHAAEERKLKRVRSALKTCPPVPDWKKRVARRALVTSNFITYAINRGKINIPATLMQ